MTGLAGIPIRIEPARVDGLGGGVTALLHEVATLLERLATSNEPAAIDLRSLPMSAPDRLDLRRALGEGEVHATLSAEGVSIIRETRIPGVWWIEHRDPQEQLIAELIEVTCIPAILARERDEIAAGARALRAQMAQTGAPVALPGGSSAGRQ